MRTTVHSICPGDWHSASDIWHLASGMVHSVVVAMLAARCSLSRSAAAAAAVGAIEAEALVALDLRTGDLSIHPSIFLSAIYLPIYLSIYPSIYLSSQ